MPPGRDNNRRVIGFMPPLSSLSDPVNMGKLEGRGVVDSPSELFPANTSDSAITDRSSSSGNETARSKICGDKRNMKFAQRDLIRGENPWNGAKVTANPQESRSMLPISKCTTLENPVIQPPASASAVVTTWAQLTVRDLV